MQLPRRARCYQRCWQTMTIPAARSGERRSRCSAPVTRRTSRAAVPSRSQQLICRATAYSRGPDGMRKPPRLAIIGAGAMAREHIKAFLDLPGVSVAGIWNRTSGRAEKLASEFGISVVADSIEELYARTRADLAIVAVYETAINAVMKQALAHPWAILM